LNNNNIKLKTTPSLGPSQPRGKERCGLDGTANEGVAVNRQARQATGVRELFRASVATAAAQGSNFIDVQFHILLGLTERRSKEGE
jgi:hypothetical protein